MFTKTCKKKGFYLLLDLELLNFWGARMVLSLGFGGGWESFDFWNPINNPFRVLAFPIDDISEIHCHEN